MGSDADVWRRQSDADLDTARYNIDGGRFAYGAFLCQQAAEKALKALLLDRGHGLLRVHDLTVLASAAGAPDEVLKSCEALDPHYIASRYPVGVPPRTRRTMRPGPCGRQRW